MGDITLLAKVTSHVTHSDLNFDHFVFLCTHLHVFLPVLPLQWDCVDSNSVFSTLADRDAAKVSDVRL